MQTAQRKSFSTSPLKRVRTNQIAGDQAESCCSYYTANHEENKSARLQESARLVAPPTLCRNHAGTGTAARAVGVAPGDNDARIAARSRVGAMCQLCNVCVDVRVRLIVVEQSCTVALAPHRKIRDPKGLEKPFGCDCHAQGQQR